MNQKVRLLFIFCFLLTILSIATPLTFHNLWIRNIFYSLTFLLPFTSSKNINRLKQITKNKPRTFIFVSIFLFILLIAPLIIIFWNGIFGQWETVSIDFRNKKYPSVYIAKQMFDVGGYGSYRRRTVKVVPILGFLEWATLIDYSKVDRNNWTKVKEDYNPFGWKEI